MKLGRRQPAWMASALLLALGIGVTTLALAAGPGPGARPSPAHASTRAHGRVGFAPDPPAIRSSAQWVMTLRYRQGKVQVTSARRVRLRRPVTTPRHMGRYALELLSGPTVIERLRFDFPLVAADELAGRRRPYDAPPRFSRKVTVTRRVMVPDTSRASRARLVDRATGESFMIPWPPTSLGQAGRGRAKPRRTRDAGTEAGTQSGTQPGTRSGGEAGAKPKAKPKAKPNVEAGADAGKPMPRDASPGDGGTRHKGGSHERHRTDAAVRDATERR